MTKFKLHEILILVAFAFAYVAPAKAAIPVPDWVMSAQVRQHSGIVYVRVTVAGMTECFTNITEKIVALPDRWQTLSELSANPPPATLTDVQVCTDTLPNTLWVVSPNPSATDSPPTRPLKSDSGLIVGRVPVGFPCAEETVKTYTAGREYHYATNAEGIRGITICEKK